MSVTLNPSNSLGFKRPFTQAVKRSLTITNRNAHPVAFKVKTTAPKLYCVRPNSGRVEPGESVEVAVMLQAMREDPPLSTQCRDKFLIQSTLIGWEKQTMSLQEIWNATENNADRVKVFQQKLIVVYLPAEGQTLEEVDEEAVNNSSMLNDPISRYDTVRQHPNGHSSLPIPELNEEEPVLPTTQKTDETQVGMVPSDRPSTPPADFTVAREDSQEEPAADHSGADVADTIYIQPPVIIEPEPTRDQLAEAELLAKYQAAQAEIERLQALLAEVPSSPPNELRRRNRPLSDDGSTVGETEGGTGVEDPLQPEGVPLQVVVIIALGVFITTYLFF